MMVATIEDLTIMAVLERGIPNKECVAIKANNNVNLGQYGLMLGISSGSGKGAWPIKDNLLWFGEGWLKTDDWLFIYTGPGRAHSNAAPNTTQTWHSIHWDRKQTIFHLPQIVPILFRVDAVSVDDPPPAVPALTGSGQA
jgi:hypothetical protein